MVKKELRKLTLASILTALSIVLDIAFKVLVPATQSFGFPFYAIPLVIGSIVLGPIYGGTLAFISDSVLFFAARRGYYSLIFALQAISWVVITFLLPKIISDPLSVTLAILISRLVASTLSTTADFLFHYLTVGKAVNQALLVAF